MKKFFNTSRIIIFYMFMILFSMSIVLASNSVSYAPSISFEYNILATVSEGTTIDTTSQSKLKFNLFESIDEIYYNGHLVNINNNSFEIDITGLHGKTTFTFTNKDNESVSFTYYLSNIDGLLEDYEILKDFHVNSYITTYHGIKIIYTNQEKESVDILTKIVDQLPQNLLENVDTIKMIPFKNHSRIAGVTKNNTITLYLFSDYSEKTKQNILIHEIAHTWANKLISEGTSDYTFSEYQKVIELDKNQVSRYAKRSTEKNGRPSEDFAESVAFYFINPVFSKLYPNRTRYIQELLAM
mgnify:CR=1 FL=1